MPGPATSEEGASSLVLVLPAHLLHDPLQGLDVRFKQVESYTVGRDAIHQLGPVREKTSRLIEGPAAGGRRLEAAEALREAERLLAV